MISFENSHNLISRHVGLWSLRGLVFVGFNDGVVSFGLIAVVVVLDFVVVVTLGVAVVAVLGLVV